MDDIVREQPTVVVFAGAGASLAISDRYPTTVGFFENHLSSEIKNDGVFRFAAGIARDQSGTDIEKVLWQLSELHDFHKAGINTTSITGKSFVGKALGEALYQKPDARHEMGNVQSMLKESVRRTANLIEQINKLVFDIYNTPPQQQELSFWVNFINSIEARDARVELFTTNYDVILESVIRHSGAQVEMAPLERPFSALDFSSWEGAYTPQGAGKLTKLHGSVNWSIRSDGGISEGAPDCHGSTSNHALIYPGFKGVPVQEPFVAFHKYLRSALQVADSVVFLGFAFRDEYLNEIFLDAINFEKTSVVVVNPSVVDFPFPDHMALKHIKKKFEAETVIDMLKDIDKALIRASRA